MDNKTFLLHIIMTVILTLLIIVQIISICVFIDISRTVEEESLEPGKVEQWFRPTDNVTDNITLYQPKDKQRAKEYILSTGIPDREYSEDYDCSSFARDLDKQFIEDRVDGGMALLVYIKNGKVYKVHRTNFITIGNYTCSANAQTGRVLHEWPGGVKIRVD